MLPEAEISNAGDIENKNTTGTVKIELKASDKLHNLKRYNVFVNEVPMFGSIGISIEKLKTQDFKISVTVPLSIGENKIQVSVINDLGLENFRYSTYVNYTPKNSVVVNTYFIGIGVDEFTDSEATDLNFCVKDVTDLNKELSKDPYLVSILLTNKDVTKENILKLKNTLLNTTVNDKVIILCSSHGVRDKERNLYLAMSDMEFKNPKEKGLLYEELANLLDSIPARKKLLLLDACNSGELDKTQQLTYEDKDDESALALDNNSTRGSTSDGKTIQLKKNSFSTMMELFVDVNNNSGATIISAAGGIQQALEGVEVNGNRITNGAFTYSILEYLRNNAEQPERLSVKQLKQYVEIRVLEITNGEQKPTSRKETMETDWTIR